MSFEPGVKHTMQNLVWGGGKGWTARHIDYYVPGLGPLLLRGGFGTGGKTAVPAIATLMENVTPSI